MQHFPAIIKNEEGSLIVIVLMILVMVTILGVSATTISRTELMISTNELISQKLFFTADAGIEHIRKQLQIPLAAINAGSTGGVNLTFALQGFDGSHPAEGFNYEEGAQWIYEKKFELDDMPHRVDPMYYTVQIWNNPNDFGPDGIEGTLDDYGPDLIKGTDDDGNITMDGDSLVYARSTAKRPRTGLSGGGTSSIEVLLLGRIKPGTARSITGYSGQEGAGSGKSYVSSDANAMSATALNTTQGTGLLQ